MGYIRGESRNQIYLLPETVDDYIGEGDPVRRSESFRTIWRVVRRSLPGVVKLAHHEAITRWGAPDTVVSDHGAVFLALQPCLAQLGIQWSEFPTPFCAQATEGQSRQGLQGSQEMFCQKRLEPPVYVRHGITPCPEHTPGSKSVCVCAETLSLTPILRYDGLMEHSLSPTPDERYAHALKLHACDRAVLAG